MSSEQYKDMKEKNISAEAAEEKKEQERQETADSKKDSKNNSRLKKESGNGKKPKNTEQVNDSEQVKEKEEESTDASEKRIEELEEELKTVKDSLLRKAAELENVRKRVQRERLQLFEDAKAAAIEDFMPISDDLMRTLSAAKESEIEDNFLKGVEMVNKKFQEVLDKYGVERINETNVPFDIDLHDAMMKQPAPNDEVQSNMVLQVLESGYRIGNRTIKHAKVIVSE